MKKNKVVAYMRFSSHNQNESSIEYQQTAIEKYCHDHDFEIVERYIDRAETGTNDHRTAFQTMMEDAKQHPVWKRVIVYDLSRFSRNVKDATKNSGILQDCGIELISVMQPIQGKSASAKLCNNIFFALNQHYSDCLAETTHAGLTNTAKKAKHCGGTPPFGYDLDDKGSLIINQKESKIVKEIFDLYELGYSYSKIAETLNLKNDRTKRGNPFTKNSFCEILKQKKYVGTFVWNKASKKKSNQKRNTATQKSHWRSR